MADESKAPTGMFFRRIAIVFFVALSVFALTSFLSYQLERRLIVRVNRLLRDSVAWAQVAEDTEDLEAALEKCLGSGDKQSRIAYNYMALKLENDIRDVAADLSPYRDVLAIEDIQGMVATMLAQAKETLDAHELQSYAQSNTMFSALGVTGEYIRDRVHLAVMDFLQRESGKYKVINTRLDMVSRVALLLILGGLVLAMLVLAVVSYRITRPLAELAEAAEKVSQGDFSQAVPIRKRDEVGHVAVAFNQMSQSLARLIGDLQEKTALEVRLKEQEVENLATQNLLQETRLQALQAQMNPHFFFNTLNTGVHLANLENAERTAAFFENVGSLFRYSLRSTGVAVALEEELSHVENYVAFLHMRYSEEAFTYLTEIEPALLDTQIPRLTLQPLVENAYLHGLANTVGGRISIRAFRNGGNHIIEVADSGIGISRQAAEEALLPREREGGSSSTVGLANVIARLQLWTGLANPVEILGQHGGGTVIRLQIPLRD